MVYLFESFRVRSYSNSDTLERIRYNNLIIICSSLNHQSTPSLVSLPVLYTLSVKITNILVLSVSRTKHMIYLFESFRVRCYVDSNIFERNQTNNLIVIRSSLNHQGSPSLFSLPAIYLLIIDITHILVLSINMTNRMVYLFESCVVCCYVDNNTLERIRNNNLSIIRSSLNHQDIPPPESKPT